MAARMAALADQQLSNGKYFSIENPWDSFIWLQKPFLKLALHPDVRMTRIHQCAYGFQHKKDTGILTNAEWIPEKLCDMAVRPHRHVPLMGFATDYRLSSEPKVFKTAR